MTAKSFVHNDLMFRKKMPSKPSASATSAEKWAMETFTVRKGTCPAYQNLHWPNRAERGLVRLNGLDQAPCELHRGALVEHPGAYRMRAPAGTLEWFARCDRFRLLAT